MRVRATPIWLVAWAPNFIPSASFPATDTKAAAFSKAYQSSLYEAHEAETEEIVDLCERAQRLMPELGPGRVEAAECFQRATVLPIELVGGTVGEQILYPQDEPLPTYHD
jgi:hypothetical protein